MNKNHETFPFYIKDCALISIATGEKAYHLRELQEKIQLIHPGCIYHHFWGARLLPHFETREYHNDFAMWAYHILHDQTLGERLAIIDPTDYKTIEDLRREILRVLEERLDETEREDVVLKVVPFRFVRSQIIIFNTPYIVSKPEEFADILPKLTKTSIFYHFIDAYERTSSESDDLSSWLEALNKEKYAELIQSIREIDFYFMSLGELQKRLELEVSHFFFREKQ